MSSDGMTVLTGLGSGEAQNLEFKQLHRRKRIADLYLRGKSQYAICEEMSMSTATLAKDLEVIRAQWIAEGIMDFDAKKSIELAKIDHMEEVCWEGYWKSCEDAEIRYRKREFIRQEVKGQKGQGPSYKMIPVKVKEDRQVKGQTGNTKFLERVCWCIETRLKLIGLLKEETKVNVVNLNWDQLCGAPPEDDDPIALKIAQVESISETKSESMRVNPDGAEPREVTDGQ